MPDLQILFQDDFLVAINKPNGLLVHRSPIAKDAEEFAIQLLRDQLNQHVQPLHRLDRKTSGVLLFGLDKKIEAPLNAAFTNGNIEKKYYAIVRGFAPEEGIIDYALKRDDGKVQEAVTHFKRLATTQIELASGKHTTSRYSLVDVNPKTGRMHQIRKHFAHIFHPIIGDRPHGCNKQNKIFKDKWAMDTMMLHARELSFVHPITEEKIIIKAPLLPEFIRTMELLNFSIKI